jgi:hypothetical protein
LKKIGDFGAQQLRLDLETIKTVLLKLPTFRNPNVPVPARYERYNLLKLTVSRYSGRVQKMMGKVELLLKVIATPSDQVVEAYKTLIPDGTEAEFQKIIEMKASLDFFNLILERVSPVSSKKRCSKLTQEKARLLQSW